MGLIDKINSIHNALHTVAKTSNPKTATATSSSLPKTAGSHWIAVSALLFVLGTAALKAVRRR